MGDDGRPEGDMTNASNPCGWVQNMESLPGLVAGEATSQSTTVRPRVANQFCQEQK